jgi:hypothetical protein
VAFTVFFFTSDFFFAGRLVTAFLAAVVLEALLFTSVDRTVLVALRFAVVVLRVALPFPVAVPARAVFADFALLLALEVTFFAACFLACERLVVVPVCVRFAT